MEPSRVYHVFLISFLQYDIVIWFMVAIETVSTIGAARASTTDSRCEVERCTLGEAPCPPPDHLHLLCDVTIGNVTCPLRAQILKRCLHTFRVIYIHSKWNTCSGKQNSCVDIVDFLTDEKLIDQSGYRTATEASTIGKPVDSNTSVTHISVTSGTGSDSRISTVPSTTVTMGTDEVARAGGFIFQDSVIFPVIGTVIIFIEFLVLCAFCYRKKKGVQYEKQRRPSQGSGAVQEVPLVEETASSNKATPHKKSSLLDPSKEDQDIFKSYQNLRYIDDTEDNTPEKKLLTSIVVTCE